MKITAGNVSVGKGARRNESTPSLTIARSLRYGEGFDAHFPLHRTTRQTSWVQCLCCSKTDHLHGLIQNDFQRQVSGGSGALQWKKQYMNLSCLGCFFTFCQKTAELFSHCCMVLQSSHTVLFAVICHVYILIRIHKTKKSFITCISDAYLTCTRTCTNK